MADQLLASFSMERAVSAATAMPARVAGLWVGWRSWIKKGSLAVLDQGLISGSNFLISVLLARWMSASEYGAYALAFSIFLLFLISYQALILEPMCVFGPAQYRECEPEYFGTLLRMHAMFTVATAAIMLASSLALWKLAMPHFLIGALHGVMFAAPCVLLFWLARRVFYLRIMPGGAVVGAVLYCLILMLGLWVLYRHELLSPFTAFLLMGIGALAASFLLLTRLKLPLRRSAAFPRLGIVTQEHWRYGKWALASAAVAWVPWNCTYILIGSFHGMAATAELKALLNLVLPMQQSFAAFSLILIPYASRLTYDSGMSGVQSLSRRIAWLFAAGAFAYWFLIIIFRERAIHLFYGGKYMDVVHLVPWVAFVSILVGAVQGHMIVLRGMQAPSSIFAVEFTTSAICMAVGIPAIWFFGIRGAVAALVLASAGGLIAAILELHRRVQERTPSVIGN
jgi:O-antigen/teichoic acid export membrane protein